MNWLDRQNRRHWDEWSQSWRERWGLRDVDDCVRRRMFRGDTLIFSVQVQGPAPGAIGPCPPMVPRDITGWTAWFTAKYQLPDPDVQSVVQLSTMQGGIVFPTPTSGLATITMPAQATLSFPDAPVELEYDVQLMDLQGNVSTAEFGAILVRPDVTRAVGPSNLPAPPLPSTSAVVNGGNSPYAVLPTDGIVEFDGRDNASAVARLPLSPTIGERHTLAQTYWTGSTPPPVVSAGTNLLQAYGVLTSGDFVSQTTITDLGGAVTYQWDGAKWLRV